MYSQQMTSHELLHSNPIEHYLGSYDFPDFKFSVSEDKSQSIEFSQLPSSQELFSNHYSTSGQEENKKCPSQILPSKKIHEGTHILCEESEKMKERYINISKLRTQANEKDERFLLKTISQDVKECSMQLISLFESIQQMNNYQKEITIPHEHDLLEVKMSLEKNCQQILSVLDNIKENKDQVKELIERLLENKITEDPKKELDVMKEQTSNLITLSKSYASYHQVQKQNLLEVKKQQAEIYRNMHSVEEKFSTFVEDWLQWQDSLEKKFEETTKYLLDTLQDFITTAHKELLIQNNKESKVSPFPPNKSKLLDVDSQFLCTSKREKKAIYKKTFEHASLSTQTENSSNIKIKQSRKKNLLMTKSEKHHIYENGTGRSDSYLTCIKEKRYHTRTSTKNGTSTSNNTVNMSLYRTQRRNSMFRNNRSDLGGEVFNSIKNISIRKQISKSQNQVELSSTNSSPCLSVTEITNRVTKLPKKENSFTNGIPIYSNIVNHLEKKIILDETWI